MPLTNNREINYLLSLLRCALKGGTVEQDAAVDLQKLFRLAKRQQVYSTVLPVLEESHILSDEQLAEWNNYRFSELKKTLVVNNEREQICKQLDAAGISYMFLKGLVIREYYPKTAMRQMSDNDILYDAAQQDALYGIMKKQGYYVGASGGISDDFYKKPYATFEFHRTLFNPEEPFCPEFNPWEHAVPVEGTCRQQMSKEDNYIYALSHMYKHYYCIDGCGIRFVCDLYLLSHSDDALNWDEIYATLERFGIRKFHDTVLRLAEAVFEDGAADDDAAALLDFLFEGGVFGSSNYDIEAEIAKYGSKTGFLLHRLFPAANEMKREYRTLNDKPYLLPAYYVYRLFDKYKHNKYLMERDLNALKHRKK